ncbi:MAG: cellulase family glycosylhydrolase [Verrucomicrobia bacterium]|nr:cellulase family glycosylhydrolase [Verrucomicrobiota bacterium]
MTVFTGFAASDIPPLVLPEGVGVNIHFTRGHEQDLDLIAAGGFKFIRMDFGWGGIERRKGEYNWAAYDELTANLEQRKLRPIYILDYSNGLYEDTVISRNPISGREQRDTASPQKPESVAAFARWAAAAAQHFRGHSIIWEIWNEPNISFWKPKPDVKQYIALVQATTKAMRAANPDVTIVAPASSGFPWSFLEELLAAPGVLDGLDAVSVHPYRSYSKGPETAGEDYARLRGLIERYAPPAKKFMPILSGEWGYATHTKGGVSLETQAAFIARQQLANLHYGVPVSIWYDWKNDGLNPDYNEDNFGTVSNNLALKPSYVAVRTLTRELAGYRIARRLQTPNAAEWLLVLFNNAGDQKLAAWTTGQPSTFSLRYDLPSPGDVSAVDGQGKATPLKLEQGRLRLDLTAAPQYITFKKRSRSLTAAAAWQIVEPVPSRVEAGPQNRVKLPLRLTNPFAHPVRVDLSVKSDGKAERHRVELPPGQSATREFGFPVTRRDHDFVTATVEVFYSRPEGTAWNEIGSASEERQFVLANPLTVNLAPTEAGLRLAIQDPSRSGFSGKAVIDGTTIPVNLPAGSAEFTAQVPRSATAASASLQLFEATGEVATEKATTRFSSLSAPAYKAALDGDAKVPANASLVETNAPGDREQPFAQAHRLDYRFDAGWRFVRCAANGAKLPAFEGTPKALGLWVYGDASGNALRTRVTDASGQTFQPGAPDLNWTGWRWVTFDLTDLRHAGHWGGANDGVVHGALRLDTLLLVDGSSKKTSGTIFFAGPALVY